MQYKLQIWLIFENIGQFSCLKMTLTLVFIGIILEKNKNYDRKIAEVCKSRQANAI